MRLTLRFYKRHDLDLLYLCYVEDESFDIKTDIKEILAKHIKGKSVKKDLPIGDCRAVSAMPSLVQLHIPLNEKEDKAIIQWLQTLTKGRRNCAIKAILRNAYPLVTEPFNKENEDHKMMKKG